MDMNLVANVVVAAITLAGFILALHNSNKKSAVWRNTIDNNVKDIGGDIAVLQKSVGRLSDKVSTINEGISLLQQSKDTAKETVSEVKADVKQVASMVLELSKVNAKHGTDIERTYDNIEDIWKELKTKVDK